MTAPLELPAELELSFDPGCVERARVHGWLSASYWSPRQKREVFDAALENSLVVGAYLPADARRPQAPRQLAYARAVSDRATFAWICDVYVDERWRGRGLARQLVRALLGHPQLRTCRRVLLATRDAHGVYSALGFGPLAEPARWLELRPPADNWQLPELGG